MGEVSAVRVTQQSFSIPSLFSRFEQDNQSELGKSSGGHSYLSGAFREASSLAFLHACTEKHQAYQRNINQLVASILHFEDERGDEKCILI